MGNFCAYCKSEIYHIVMLSLQTEVFKKSTSAMSHWSVPLPGQVMTQTSPAMVTEHSDWVPLEVISLDVRVQLCEPCSIIHLINVSRQLMNIHNFHLTGSEKESEDKTK